MRADPQVSAGSTPFQGDDLAPSGPSRERMDGPAALSFAQLRAVNVERAARWHPGFPNDGKWNGADWSNAAAGEMGEACNVVKKLRRQETGGRGAVDPDYHVLLSKLGDEIADTIIYLDLLAAFYGVNTAEAVAAKFNAVSVREGLPERLS
jgi:NTP pyrophosphatase (non-canonical NTP hydrolase)